LWVSAALIGDGVVGKMSIVIVAVE